MAIDKINEIKRQSERFRLLIEYLREAGLYKSAAQLCEEMDMSKSHFSSVINGRLSPIGVAEKICKHFELPFLQWVETGEGIAPLKHFINGVKYIGHLDENSFIDEYLMGNFSPIILPKNIQCDIVFVYRGKMYFVNKVDTFHRITDSGLKYFVELNSGQKVVKRIAEKTYRDTRVMTFIDPDDTISNFELPISSIHSVYRIIGTLEFSR